MKDIRRKRYCDIYITVSLRSLPLFCSAVPVGRRQKNPPSSVPQALHSTKKKSSLEKKQLFFLRCFVPRLHTVTSCVRRGYYIHNTASFRFATQATLHCIPAVLCLSPLISSAVAPSHSNRGWLR